MPEFTGSLRLASDPATSVIAEVVIDEEHLVVSSGASQIGDWERREIEIDVSADGFRLRVDGEDLILDMTDPEGFAAAAGIPPFEPKREIETGPRRIKPLPDRPSHGRAPFPTADSLSSRFNQLRHRSAADYPDDSTVRQVLVRPLAAAAALVGGGALLGWGPFRLVGDSGFPVARLLAGIAAVTAGVGIYLASRRHQRARGVPMIVASAALSLLVVSAYATEAGLGIGFLLSFGGVVGLGALGVIAMTDWGSMPRRRDDED